MKDRHVRSTIEASPRRRINSKHRAHVDEKTARWLVHVAEETDCFLGDIDRSPEIDLKDDEQRNRRREFGHTSNMSLAFSSLVPSTSAMIPYPALLKTYLCNEVKERRRTMGSQTYNVDPSKCLLRGGKASSDVGYFGNVKFEHDQLLFGVLCGEAGENFWFAKSRNNLQVNKSDPLKSCEPRRSHLFTVRERLLRHEKTESLYTVNTTTWILKSRTYAAGASN